MLNELALFAGAGGGILGGQLIGWSTRCAVEIDPYCRSVLLARQKDGFLPTFPIWDDVRTFDGFPWRETIDVITGGFPCTDISAAGKGACITGKSSSLFFEMLRIIEEVRPRFVFAENSPNLRTRGLGAVVAGLTRLGYDCKWCVLGARHVGAPHRRDRMWLLATYSDRKRCETRAKRAGREAGSDACRSSSGATVANAAKQYRSRQEQETFEYRRSREDVADTEKYPERESSNKKDSESNRRETWEEFSGRGWWDTEPDLGRVAHGVAHRVDRLKALGNGQVPAVAALAWEILSCR